jgi:hypothetical protein
MPSQSLIKEIGTPDRILVTSIDDYLKLFKTLNGKTNLFETVYKFKYLKTEYQPDYESAIIDKIFFDADSSNSWNAVKKFHEYLMSINIKHTIKQSSLMRFHIMVASDDTDVDNKKRALKNAMIGLSNDANLTFGKSDECDFDYATFGDLSRLCRIPGTFNVKRKSWCNYVTEEELYSEDKLKEVSQSMRTKQVWFGKNKIKLKDYDFETEYTRNEVANYGDFDMVIEGTEFIKNVINTFPPFIQKILNDYNDYGTYKNRWRFAIYCRDIGMPKSTVDEIANIYFSKIINTGSLKGRGTNYDHFKKFKVLKLVFESDKAYTFPHVIQLLNEGYEITEEDEKDFEGIYF